jgi:hypothetical protein
MVSFILSFFRPSLNKLLMTGPGVALPECSIAFFNAYAFIESFFNMLYLRKRVIKVFGMGIIK